MTWYDTARASAWSSFAVAGLLSCWLLVQTANLVYQASQDEQKIAVRLEDTLDTINETCTPGPCGTLADVAKTLNTFRGVGGQIEIAANHINRSQSTLDTQEQNLFLDIHSTLAESRDTVADIGTTAQSASRTLDSFQPIAGHLDQATVTGYETLARVEVLVNDPSWLETVRNVDAMTKTTDQMLDTANQVETKATHDYLHPSKNPFVRSWQIAKPFVVPSIQIGGAVAATIH